MTNDQSAMSYRSLTFFSRIGQFTLPVLLILLTACQTIHAPASSGHLPSKQPRPSISFPDLEKRIHDLINHQRKKHGLSTLTWDDRLAQVARIHSKDMAKRSYFSHDSPEGHDFSFRYREQGYQCSLRTGNTIHLGAENIALNHLYRSVTTINGVPHYDWNSAEEIAETTVQGWMGSLGHRKNILTPHWINEGIGVFLSPDDKIFITQNFC